MSAEIDEFVERVRVRSDIYSVISGYISLKFKNGRYRAQCPFHEDDAESFSIAPDKGFFYCFHCHAGGDALKFISMKENISYFEAAKKQAEKLRISLPLRKKDPEIFEFQRQKKTLLKINRLARDFYHEFLKKYEAEGEGRKYFETRGITEGAIEEFKLGFAPKNSDKLTNLLLEKKFTPKELVDSGLVSRQDDAEKLVDTMQDCLVIPATDIFGFVLGIGGRILESAAENDSPKFFDIPHSVAFDNKNFIFGVKKSVNSLVVVNDYTDVVFLNGAGVKNVVASSDGLLNESRLRFLLKYAKRIIFCREKSEISQDKLTKLLSVAKDFENKVFFFSIPEGCALQTFIRKNGKGKFFEIVRNALSIFDLRLQNILNQNAHSSSEEKIETLKKIFQIVPGEKKADVSEEYLKKISDALELEKDKILEEWRKFQSSPPAENKVELRPKKADSPEKFSQDDRAFARLCVAILRTCWYEDALSDFALSMIPNEEFSEVHKEILEYIKKNSDEERSLELSQAENELSKEAYAEISKILAGYGDELKDEDRKAFNDSVRTARRICLQKSYDAKIAEAQQYFGQNDYDSYQKISKETDKLRKEIDRLQ